MSEQEKKIQIFISDTFLSTIFKLESGKLSVKIMSFDQ